MKLIINGVPYGEVSDRRGFHPFSRLVGLKVSTSGTVLADSIEIEPIYLPFVKVERRPDVLYIWLNWDAKPQALITFYPKRLRFTYFRFRWTELDEMSLYVPVEE